MNITVLVFVVVFCLCTSNGASDARLQRKQQRPTRGFKNVEMMTARGFGKRARTERDVEHQTPPERTNRGTPTFKSPSVGIARDFGKRTAELDFEDEPVRRKFNPKGPLMVAYEFGKRSNGDLNEEEEEIRVTRGTFKPNSNVLIARGYGKREDIMNGDEEVRVSRGGFKPKSNDGGYLFARGYGKRQDTANEVYGLDNFWENLESQEKEAQDGADEKTLESIPLDWFVNEIINNPDFARSVVRKFIDLNQDGLLSSDELLRNV